MLVFDPDADLLQLLQRLALDQDRDALEVVGEHAQRARPLLGVFALQERGVDVNREAVHLLHDRVEARARRGLRRASGQHQQRQEDERQASGVHGAGR